MPPQEMYGRIMSMSDEIILPYFENVTDVPTGELDEMKQALAAGENPRNLKMRLAREIITQFHNAAAAGEGEEYFIRTIQKREAPEEMPEHRITAATGIVDLLADTKLAPSRSEARRLIENGGVKINGTKVESQDVRVEPGDEYVLQVGKRKFVRIISE